MSRPPFNLRHVEESTRHGLMRGHRIMQTFRYATDDDEHVELLLDMFNLPQHAHVLDAGCGVGEMSHLMSRQRPDLTFLMVNISRYQLSFCPEGKQYTRLQCDFHDAPVTAATLDAVMFNSALVQMDREVALAQAFRVLRPGGVLLVNEPVRELGGDPADALVAAIERAGFAVIAQYWPEYTDTYFRQLLALDGLESLLDGLRPMIVKAMKPTGEHHADAPTL